MNASHDDEPREREARQAPRQQRQGYTAPEVEDLIGEAKAQVAQMVQRTEVVKAAEARARHINEEAEANARRMRREAEDFCDQRLASFENVLAKVQQSVVVGRERLAAPTIEESELRGFEQGEQDELPLPGEDSELYDQER